MEVRCPSCKKLFRVSDDKITGSGIKFACTRCRETVKITSADFEQYKLSKPAPGLAPALEPAVLRAAPAATAVAEAASGMQDFDLSDPATAAAAMQHEEELLPEFGTMQPPEPSAPGPVSPNPVQKSHSAPPAQAGLKPSPTLKPEIEAKPAPAKLQPAISADSKRQPPPASSAARGDAIPAVASADNAFKQPDTSWGAGRKIAILVILLLIMGGAGFGVKFYLDNASQQAPETARRVTSPDGLLVQTASGVIDAENGDLVISGVVENATDQPRAAWFIMADVYDAQTSVLMTSKLLNGKQLYTRRDYEIMAKRGVDIQQLKQTLLQEQGVVIPARGRAAFEIRIMEPPVGVASFNAALQPFDPVQLFKEMAEEQR